MRSLMMLLLSLPLLASGQAATDHAAYNGHQGMQLDQAGIVMNANHETLPRGCSEIGTDQDYTIRVGRKYAGDEPGMIFGMSQHEVRVQPCARVQITLVNEDDVRHQWMVHGLPKYLYPAGMFHVEAMGGQTVTGTFIVPAEDKNFLVHCDMAQHMEKGMRGQLVVGRGSGDLWSVPGTTDAFYRSAYLPGYSFAIALVVALVGFFAALRLPERS